MRQIGKLPSGTLARQFADYALTRDIRVNVEDEGEDWAVWVYEEDLVPKAKAELDSFREDPQAEKYINAQNEANALREQEVKKHREAKKKVVKANETWNRSYMQRAPVTVLLIVMSVGAVLATTPPDRPFDFGSKTEPGLTWLSFAPIWEENGNRYAPVNRFEAILQGEVWRLITPIFLHFSILHLLFNMMWLQDLGGAIESRRSKWQYLALVLLIAVISNTAQAVMSGPNFGGMSGVVFGLFGYVWMQSRYVPESGFYMPPNLVMFMLIWMVLCYSGVVGPIANTAHTAGLIIGMAAGYAPKLWRDLTR